MANIQKRPLPAIYYYIRSLATPHPFTVAKENLGQIFEQARVNYHALSSFDDAARKETRPAYGWKLPDLVRHVETRLLHLHGESFITLTPFCSKKVSFPSPTSVF